MKGVYFVKQNVPQLLLLERISFDRLIFNIILTMRYGLLQPIRLFYMPASPLKSQQREKTQMNGFDQGTGRASAILRLAPVGKSKGGEISYQDIETSMRSLNGVLNTMINHVNHTIKVDYDPSRVTLEQVREKLRVLRGV